MAKNLPLVAELVYRCTDAQIKSLIKAFGRGRGSSPSNQQLLFDGLVAIREEIRSGPREEALDTLEKETLQLRDEIYPGKPESKPGITGRFRSLCSELYRKIKDILSQEKLDQFTIQKQIYLLEIFEGLGFERGTDQAAHIIEATLEDAYPYGSYEQFLAYSGTKRLYNHEQLRIDKPHILGISKVFESYDVYFVSEKYQHTMAWLQHYPRKSIDSEFVAELKLHLPWGIREAFGRVRPGTEFARRYPWLAFFRKICLYSLSRRSNLLEYFADERIIDDEEIEACRQLRTQKDVHLALAREFYELEDKFDYHFRRTLFTIIVSRFVNAHTDAKGEERAKSMAELYMLYRYGYEHRLLIFNGSVHQTYFFHFIKIANEHLGPAAANAVINDMLQKDWIDYSDEFLGMIKAFIASYNKTQRDENNLSTLITLLSQLNIPNEGSTMDLLICKLKLRYLRNETHDLELARKALHSRDKRLSRMRDSAQSNYIEHQKRRHKDWRLLFDAEEAPPGDRIPKKKELIKRLEENPPHDDTKWMLEVLRREISQ